VHTRICRIGTAIVGVVIAATGLSCSQTTGGSEIADRSKLQRFAPLPNVLAAKGTIPSEEMVSLGRVLYHDPRLSRSQTLSCNSCHPLSSYGADGQATSAGFKGQRGSRNSPTVYNAAAHFVQFWDGRAPDVEAQAKGPMLNPVEMAMPSGKAVESVLRSMPEYATAFRRAFPGEKNPVTFDHAAEAIGAFERKLLTPARWDRFLRGEEAALTPAEKGGFNVFIERGCSTCHSGALVGGEAFQRLGVATAYPDKSDPGRYQVTQKESDRMVFKTPSLRNVARTGPYFHNGKVGSLLEAVNQMAEYQTGKKVTAPEAEAIVTWLNALTGDLPPNYSTPPQLPKSTPRTPKAISGD
jgi:cytochrome c peroxidase